MSIKAACKKNKNNKAAYTKNNVRYTEIITEDGTVMQIPTSTTKIKVYY